MWDTTYILRILYKTQSAFGLYSFFLIILIWGYMVSSLEHRMELVGSKLHHGSQIFNKIHYEISGIGYMMKFEVLQSTLLIDGFNQNFFNSLDSFVYQSYFEQLLKRRRIPSSSLLSQWSYWAWTASINYSMIILSLSSF